MTIGEDIMNWAAERPYWQQRILRTLASGNAVTEEDVVVLINSLLEPSKDEESLEPLDLALAPPDEQPVTLSAIRDAKGVNALKNGEDLSFSRAGLNVVYGDNGSGKSGYARLIKEMVGARHPAEILPDVFKATPDDPSALLVYAVGPDEEQQKYPGVPDASVKKMSFHDEHCGDAYLDKRSILTYRPSALVVLDGLIEVCDRVRDGLQGRLYANSRHALQLNIQPQTGTGAFLAGLSPTTTAAAIDAATRLDDDTDAQRAKAAADVARLESTNVDGERRRLTTLSEALDRLVLHLRQLSRPLSQEALAETAQQIEKATALRAAAQLAANNDFSADTPGVGSATWRALWAAAREYSIAEAYHDQEFPVVHEEARCVFCNQPLGEEARDRLHRFNSYMTDTTERDATQAEGVVGGRLEVLQSLATTSARYMADHGDLTEVDPELAGEVSAAVSRGEAVRVGAVAWLEHKGEQPSALDLGSTADDLAAKAKAYTDAAAAIDVAGFQSALTDARRVRNEIEAKVTLAASAEGVRAEVERLKERQALERAQAQVNTGPITTKSTQLTQTYAGEEIRDQFTRETDRLQLERVTIRDLGGSKGQLEQIPGLLGASAANVRSRQVLSEGEQTAMGLAGFFTEAAFDASKSALILDDPVTSLDHVRRGQVAGRLAELAADRQVVVFTHDVVFAGELQKRAEQQGVALTTRSIERMKSQPGHVRPQLPWKAKDFGGRLNQIEVELARLTRERDQFGQDAWDKAVGAWAGDLSELWESCATTEVLDEVFDRGKSEVRVLKLKILVAITQDDDTDFQTGYGACSKWARRHNKSPETNYVPPEPAEMKAEVDRIRAWQKRIKGYRK